MASSMDDAATRAIKMDQTLKSRKEEFVSNLSGGDISEINLVTLVGPAAIVLWSALQSRQSFFTPYGATAMVADFLLNVGMPLMAMTAYSSAPALLLALLLTPAFFITITTHLIPRSKAKSVSTNQKTSAQRGAPQPSPNDAPIHRPFLTMYRGSMMIQTCLAILAVDFRVFPRRFAKVETWGTSLMDLGVGSFVFSAGVVSARSLLKSKSQSQSHPNSPQQSPRNSSLLHRLPPSLRHSLPLLLLGLIRLLSVKSVDYAEHVTEYGVHWNFFFTLAFLPPSVSLFDTITALIPMLSYELLALVLSVGCQVLLDSTPLTRYILLAPRGPDLLSQNREGVFSFAGYLAIFLAARGLGVAIFSDATTTNNNKPTSTSKSKSQSKPKSKATPTPKIPPLLPPLLLRPLLHTTLFLLLTHPSSPLLSLSPSISLPTISRRLANLPYTLWICAFNSTHLLLLYLVESFYFPPTPETQTPPVAVVVSPILHTLNAHALPTFLAANLLTGLVNLGVNTLDAGFLGSMAVLVAYAGVVVGVAAGVEGMKGRGWRVKF